MSNTSDLLRSLGNTGTTQAPSVSNTQSNTSKLLASFSGSLPEVTAPKTQTPVTVQSAVDSVPTPKVSFLDKVGSVVGGVGKFVLGINKPVVGFNTPSISVPEKKKAPVLEARILTGPKLEDIDAQEKDLTNLKNNIDLYDQKSVDDYNAKVNKLQSDIISYNTALGAKNVLSKDYLQPGTSLDKIESIPETAGISPGISEGDTLESLKARNESISMQTPNLDFWGKVKGFIQDIAPKATDVVGVNTGFDLFGAVKKSGILDILSESPEATADKEAVARVLTKNLQDSGQNITLAEVKTNFDQISKQIGLRDQPTNEEFTMAMLMGLGAGEIMLSSKLVPALIKTGLGLAGFEALNIVDRKLNKLITGTEQTTAQAIGRSLNANEATQAVLFIGDMFAKGGLLHFGGKGAIKIGNDFWTVATTKYNLPKSVFIEGTKIKDIFQTGTKISKEESDLVKSLGLNAEQYKNAIKNGLSIEVPGEYVTRIADKPIWSKVKKIIGAEPIDVTKIYKPEGETRVGPRALLEGPTKENIQNIATSIKEGKPIELGPTIQLPKTDIATIATEYRQAPAPVEKPELFTAKVPATSKGEIIAIARHGSTDSNGDKAFRGWEETTKNQLSAKGKEDAKALGLNIKKNIGTQDPKDFVIVSSDLNRAIDSAKIASEISGVPVGKTYPQLRSQDTGEFSGVKELEVKDQVQDINDNKPHEPLPGASETHNEFITRAKEALKPNGTIEKENPGKKIIVVTHHQVEVMSANDFSKTTDAMFEQGIKPGGLRSVKEITTQKDQVGKATEKVSEKEAPNFNIKNEQSKSLIAVHNISPGKLSFAHKIGSLINPSIAIIDIGKQGFENYGEISLIGNKNLLEQGKTFAADIYSPRFPSLTVRVPEKGFKILKEKYNKYEGQVGRDFGINDMADFDREMHDSPNVMADFLTEQGIKIPTLKSKLTPLDSSAGRYEIKQGMREIILEKGLEDKFVDYISKIKEEVGATEHIFKGYTYSGTRRYVSATPENISKDMRARGLANQEGMDYGLGSFRAQLVTRLSSLKKIAEAKGRIVTTEEFEKAKKEMDTKYSDLVQEYAKRIKPGHGSSNPFISFDEVSQGLAEYVTGKFPEFLDRFTKIPQSLKDKTQELIQEVKAMPTEYFESKFTRPVKMSEFSYAVVPDSMSKEAIGKLEAEGLEVITYQKGNEADRLAKIIELQKKPNAEDIFFNQKNGRVDLPEVPANLKRVNNYLTRLKLRGVDPVLVDAILAPGGDRAYGVSVGGTLSFEKIVQQFTEDHEVGHLIWQNFDKMRIFDGFYKKGLLAEAKTLYGNISERALEEEIMKDFQQYVADREAKIESTFFGKILEFFQRLYAALKRIFRTPRDINEFYRVMYEGKATEGTMVDNTMSPSFLKQQKEGIVDFSKVKDWSNSKFNLKATTKLTEKDIIQKLPDIELKRDIIITDVYGEKATLKQGEGITPYEMTGNKFILQDGEAFLVSKSTAQNVINNSIQAVSKEFAPELKQTEETIKLVDNFLGEKDIKKVFEEISGFTGTKKWVVEFNTGQRYVGSGMQGETKESIIKDAIESQLRKKGETTKYSQYTLPGGTNYKEILIQAPTPKVSFDQYMNEQFPKNNEGDWKAQLTKNQQNNWKNQYETFYVAGEKGGQVLKSEFKSSHWDEPNVISHLRLNERTYDGKKVAFMEELQSDWAREGRDKGFIKDIKLSATENNGYWDITDQNGNVLSKSSLANTKSQALAEATRELDIGKGVPNNPLLKNWQELSIKRALKEAVNSDAKYFSWINGPQTAARYKLSKEVEYINWASDSAGKQVVIKPKTGDKILVYVDNNGVVLNDGINFQKDWVGKNIADVIGKGVAEKIIADRTGQLENEGLNFGGEWANTLYDKQVKNIVEDLTGQKVEMLDMGLPVDKNKENLFRNYTATPNMDKPVKLTEKNMNVGDEIADGANKFWIVTKINGNGKFEAVEKNVWERANEYTITKKRSMPSFKIENVAGFEDAKELFDISEPKSQQMGIEITPEVKAIINGEAPQIAKPSGKLPFEQQVTAPPMFNLKPNKKFPEFNSGNKLEDTKNALKYAEKRMGVSSIVNSLEEKKALLEVAKESLNDSPMKELEPYVADAGAYKGELPEVTGKKAEEIKKNIDFKGVKNKKALLFAQKGDQIVESMNMNYNTNLDSEDARAEFEQYQLQKENIVKHEKEFKKQVELFGKTDTFDLVGKDKTLVGEITATKETPESIKELIDQVNLEKKARREEVLNHPARPLMKYVSNGKLPKIGSKTAFGKEGIQILKDLKFNDVSEANKAIADYIAKRNEFINPLSRMRLDERNAKFLRDKQKIMAEVEKKIRAEGKNRRAIIEDIRDYFYMTEGEMKDVIGTVDFRLLSDYEFNKLTDKIREESLKIAEHAVAVSEVEWTIAQKELHRVENLQQVMEFPLDLNKMTTEQLDTLNFELQKFDKGDVFLGVREIETLAKNAGLPNVKTQRQILEEVIGKRTNIPISEIKKIVIGSFDEFRTAISLSRQNAFYDVLVSDAYQLKIEAAMRYQEIENKTNELVKNARNSRKKTLVQRIAPTDDMVISYLEEGDLETRNMIARDMTGAELELAHFIQAKYAEMRDFLVSREQLDRIRENYYTHRPRGFLEAWLRDGQTKSLKQFVGAFAKAFKETIVDVHKMDEATFKILDEQTEEILPLEKFFKYSMRRSGQLIPTRNLANAFLGYVKTFEIKVGLDQYIPRMEAVARALTPTEQTEGGLLKDTSLERFVKKWINTQKGRPISIGPIHPGDTVDSLLRTGVAFTRFLDLALRIPAQIMSLVGEESATFINIGAIQYAKGQARALTKQGKAIGDKYEAFIGRTFWDKMKDQSVGIESKLGETLFAFYGIAARNANIHHLLGVLTPEEFKTGNITPERLTAIKMEMTRWRADELLSSVVGKTSVGAVFTEHKSWAIPIFNQTLSNLQDLGKMVKSGEYKTAAKSREFGELFRATMLTLFLVLTASKIYQDLKDKGTNKRNLTEELLYRAINDAFSFMSALSPTTLLTTPRLMTFVSDLSTNVSLIIAGLAMGTRTATTGEVPGLTPLVKQFTPKLFSPLLQPSEQDKVMTSITTTTLAAQKKLDAIDPKVSDPAKTAWTEVKKVGVGTEEANAIVNELSDEEYTAYKSVKAADVSYWTGLATKVTPIVEQAFKLQFGTPEADALIASLTDDEYISYKLVKKNLYGQGEATANPSDWDQQSFVQHVVNMANGWSTDPATAFDNLIHGDWKITKVKGGQIIVNRMPLSTSEAIKTKAAKNNANYRLSHAVPLELGGTNRPENLQIIETEKDIADIEVENYLARQLSNSNITGREAREMIIRYKAGLGEPLTPELMKEYETKYGNQPLTFNEIKQEISVQ